MRINKDNVVGAIVMLLIVAFLGWGYLTTVKVNRTASAHDNLVLILQPVLRQLEMQRQMQEAQKSQQQDPKAIRSATIQDNQPAEKPASAVPVK